jgi:molybdate transport system ATP-binding protein
VELRRLLERIRIPALLVTHDRTEAVSLGDRIVVMAEGEVRQTGGVDEVFQHPASAAVAGSVGVETILHGEVVEVKDGIARLQVGDGEISAVAREELCESQRVLVCIRAETVTLQRDSHPVESARNHFAGKIECIESDGAVERITIDCGFRLVALITRTAREELGLNRGAVVTVALKATAVHLIKDYEERGSTPV